ncbi:alpha/beta fold hydrolase [Sphingobium xenophagum]|uniref:alpha/beta fold hydrolase n=1 Tax=Sphingobium xenophagum TaxID=121428 RepID=UPI0002E6796C|nr:alpha/beta fold hydrolase [Sphingobium xenophagum]
MTTDHPELLLLAGLLCDATIWAPVADRLSDVAQVTIVDFAGLSAIADMARHALGTGNGPLLIAGHSMGGRVAIEAARQRPDRVQGLALLNTGVHMASAAEPADRGVLVDLAFTEGMAALADAWLPPMMDSDGQVDRDLMARLKAMVSAQTPESFTGQINALLNRPDAAAALRATDVPTMLLSATGDRWSPPSQHHAMLDLVPHAKLTIVPAAGHMAPVEQAEAVAQAMRAWLTAVRDAAA